MSPNRPVCVRFSTGRRSRSLRRKPVRADFGQTGIMLDIVRSSLASALRSRVGGDSDADVALVTKTGPRWFGPDAVIRRVHADPSMFVGGLRALLVQSLHPLAMAGVAGHSGYRGDPWGRLRRTSRYLAATTFGTVTDAEAAIGRVQSVHSMVRGEASDGRPYSADDPHLLRWVHVAEVDSFLRCYDRFAAAPLADDERGEYLAQAGFVASRLGVADPPVTSSELRDVLAEYRPELAGTPEARDAARYLLLTPPLPLAARPGYGLIVAGAVSSLPAFARRMLHLPPALPIADRLAGDAAGRIATRVARWALTADRPA